MDLSNMIKPILESLMGHNGMLVALAVWMGTLRMIFKPIMSGIQAVVSLTPTVKDDTILADVLNSKVYKTIVFIFDYVASLKLPTAQTVVIASTDPAVK